MSLQRADRHPDRAARGVLARVTGRALGAGAASFGALGAVVLLAGPASADVPLNWPVTEVSGGSWLLVLLGLPALLFVLIALAVYLPALARGERIAPGPQKVENQWIGGPRRPAGALAAFEQSEGSQAGVLAEGEEQTEVERAGGAGTRW